MSRAVLSVDEMRAAEQAAMDAGTSEWELMRRAGESAAKWVYRMAGGRSVCVLCGPGNNGGDGYVIAESLRLRGMAVKVIAPKIPATLTARKARDAYHGDVAEFDLPKAEVYVDCLFGYGLSRKVEGQFAEILEQLAEAIGYKIAIDVPSSVASDTGAIIGPHVTYDLTVSLGAWKRAHYVMPAMAIMGSKRCVDIGLEMPETAPLVSASPKIEAPSASAHKYRRGLLAVVGGEMPGAALLAADAAMRSGAGYVKLLGDHSHPDAPSDLVIEDSPLGQSLADDRISTILIGPGLGRGKVAQEKLRAVLGTGKPVILDADALQLITLPLIEGIDPTAIGLTPHEGELAKLCEAFGIAEGSKLELATSLQQATGMTVLSKGPDTVLCSSECIRYFDRGPSWLSTAGTGDVLAGIASSRLAVHGEVARALEEAVWLHHEAARLAGPAFTASELSSAVSLAIGTYL